MEVINGEIFAVLVCLLAFGSSLIHYTAYAREKAKIVIHYDEQRGKSK